MGVHVENGADDAGYCTADPLFRERYLVITLVCVRNYFIVITVKFNLNYSIICSCQSSIERSVY